MAYDRKTYLQIVYSLNTDRVFVERVNYIQRKHLWGRQYRILQSLKAVFIFLGLASFLVQPFNITPLLLSSVMFLLISYWLMSFKEPLPRSVV